MFISSEYLDRLCTTHERRSALARQVEERGDEYILPIEVEPADLDGLAPTIGRMKLGEHSIDEIASFLIEKLRAD